MEEIIQVLQLIEENIIEHLSKTDIQHKNIYNKTRNICQNSRRIIKRNEDVMKTQSCAELRKKLLFISRFQEKLGIDIVTLLHDIKQTKDYISVINADLDANDVFLANICETLGIE